MAGVLLLRWGATALLYAFLGIAFYVMWRTLQQNARRQVLQPTPARLIWNVEGAEPTVTVLTPVSIVGRDVNNTLYLDDPFASAHHVMVMWRDNAWWIEDMGSHNGTYLNQTLLTQPTLLTFGDHIRIGETTLRFEKDNGRSSDPSSRN